ncbi:MAG: ribose-5-phosphate isomerase RpiA [Clostridia bacterium]|nr:ribose-5-phosphate isomerase RpiA [Deltaproteobacteria bacterium]
MRRLRASAGNSSSRLSKEVEHVVDDARGCLKNCAVVCARLSCAVNPQLERPVNTDALKRFAALEAVKHVKSGMRVGLGTGSTSKHALQAIAEMLEKGELTDITGMATSTATERQARALHIPLLPIDTDTRLALAIDGADEVDPAGNLIKGGGGAMLRERKVEEKADLFIVIVDESKLSTKLGLKFALPVEVLSASVDTEKIFLESLAAHVTRRVGNDGPFITDDGNAILDARFPHGIDDPQSIAAALEARSNVKAHGLFLRMTNILIVAGSKGVEVREVRK